MNIEIGLKFKAQYRIQVFGAGSDPLKNDAPRIDTGFFDNILTDSLFNSWIGGTSTTMDSCVSYCGVGSGSSTPAANNTTITQIGTRATRFSRTTSNSSLTNTATCQYRFSAGQIVGTIAEVALFTNSTGGNTNTRALIKDSGGTPTTITLTSADTLYITWRCSCTIPSSDLTGTLSISGVSYNYSMRPCNFTATIGGGSISNIFIPTANDGSMGASSGFGLGYMGAYATQTLGSNTSSPAGTGFFSSQGSVGSYTTGSLARTITYTLTPSQGNTGSGIGSLIFASVAGSSGAGFQVSIAAVSGGGTIPKDNTKTFVLPVTYTFGR